MPAKGSKQRSTGVKLIEANFGTSAIRIFNRFQVFFQF
jgi:hypothetical protein